MTMSDIQKLHSAFAALDAQGVMAHHNYWCCGGCGGNAAFNAYEKLPAAARAEIVGVTYYHEQFAENAINGHGLRLSYGALPVVSQEETAAVGEKVAKALRAAGLQVEWGGDPTECISIPKFSVTLEEIPEGEGNSLHGRDDEDEEEGW
jgi:hypothetical protein